MQYRYVILPTKLPKGDPRLSLLNDIFDLWAAVHGEVTQSSITGDHFLRNDLATAILFEGRVVAAHLYTFFDTEAHATLKSRYFQPISEWSLRALKAQGHRSLMSLEFLTVHPDFRKSRIGFSLGDTIIGLGLQILQSAGADAGTAISRMDVKVSRSAEQQGFMTLQSDIKIYGYPCCFQICPRTAVKPPPDKEVAQLIETLWARREDLTGITRSAEQPRVRAA